jgi:RNA-directed DNA polymerase
VNVKPAKQLGLPLTFKGDAFAPGSVSERPGGEEQLMERVLERQNLRAALKRVENNKGSAGADGMTVQALRPYLKKRWLSIKEELFAGR